MKNLLSSFIVPHPPIIVNEVGKGREKEAIDTVRAMEKVADEIKKLNPETIIVISPHGNLFNDYIYMLKNLELKGDFSRFGQNGMKYSYKNDIDLLGEIIALCEKNRIPAGILDKEKRKQLSLNNALDHGALVPLSFIDNNLSFKIIHISSTNLDDSVVIKFGEVIKKAIDNMQRKTVVIASGDLSHYVNDKSPYGVRKEGKKFDLELKKAIESQNLENLTKIDGKLIEKSGQCGYKSFVTLIGVSCGLDYSSKVLSYEAPFGIGYLVGRITYG